MDTKGLELARFKTNKAAEEYVVSRGYKRLPIFSREYRPGSCNREFLVGSYDAFLSWYKSLRPIDRRCHERIFDDTPIKLFMDLERSTTEMSSETFRDAVDEIVELTRGEIARTYRVEIGVPVRFDGSRATKSSQHVVFRAFFENVHHLRAFIENRILPNLAPERRSLIDVGMYTGASRKSLRLPYSTSNDEKSGNVDKPYQWSFDAATRDVKRETYDWDAMTAGFLQNWTFDDAILPSIFPVSNASSSSSAMLRASSTTMNVMSVDEGTGSYPNSFLREVCEIAETWIRQSGYTLQGPAKIYVTDGVTTRLEYILGNVVCPNKGAIHNGNKTYFHITLPHLGEYGDGFFYSVRVNARFNCADAADCPRFTWPGPDFTLTVFENVMRAVSDELMMRAPPEEEEEDHDEEEEEDHDEEEEEDHDDEEEEEEAVEEATGGIETTSPPLETRRREEGATLMNSV